MEEGKANYLNEQEYEINLGKLTKSNQQKKVQPKVKNERQEEEKASE